MRNCSYCEKHSKTIIYGGQVFKSLPVCKSCNSWLNKIVAKRSKNLEKVKRQWNLDSIKLE